MLQEYMLVHSVNTPVKCVVDDGGGVEAGGKKRLAACLQRSNACRDLSSVVFEK